MQSGRLCDLLHAIAHVASRRCLVVVVSGAQLVLPESPCLHVCASRPDSGGVFPHEVRQFARKVLAICCSITDCPDAADCLR